MNISKISKISKSILKSAVLPASLMPLLLPMCYHLCIVSYVWLDHFGYFHCNKQFDKYDHNVKIGIWESPLVAAGNRPQILPFSYDFPAIQSNSFQACQRSFRLSSISSFIEILISWFPRIGSTCTADVKRLQLVIQAEAGGRTAYIYYTKSANSPRLITTENIHNLKVMVNIKQSKARIYLLNSWKY